MGDSTPGSLLKQLERAKSSSRPPLHLWNPDLSGDIDIQILADGSWLHEGSPIKRAELVRLFASILRRESDGEYYLVTPVEKWRLRVDQFPFLVTDFELEHEQASAGGNPKLTVTLNTGVEQLIDADHPLLPSGLQQAQEIPLAILDYGLSALFQRAAWYRLVEHCEELEGQVGVYSCGLFFPLSPTPRAV